MVPKHPSKGPWKQVNRVLGGRMMVRMQRLKKLDPSYAVILQGSSTQNLPDFASHLYVSKSN